MKHVAFYHKDTGLLHQVSVMLSDDAALALNTPADHLVIDQPASGPLDPLSQRVDVASGKVIDYQPPAPSAEHEWDAGRRRWRLAAAAQGKIAGAAAARRRIARLEASQHRTIREATLGMAGARERLQGLENEIATLRALL